MNNFDLNIPTKIFFGKGQVAKIANEIKQYGHRILLVYGGGSIKKNGIYDQVTKVLKEGNFFVVELHNVKPNPSIESLYEGVKLCREHHLDFILGLGGGSVIDLSKGIAAGFYYEGDPWDFYIYRARVTKALPLGGILTLAATGSEMNGNSVVSNEKLGLKMPMGSELLKPKFSVLDPTFTYSVNAYQTAAGTADIMSHCFEQYFSAVKDTYVQDRLTEAILKTCVQYGPVAVREPANYTARAELMWSSSLALNGILTYGKQGDWATHYIEHKLSALYDMTHGVGLAMITPHWMRTVLNPDTLYKFVNLARNIWGLEDKDEMVLANKGIQATAGFFKGMGIPMTLKEAGIQLNEEEIEKMADSILSFGPVGVIKVLSREEIIQILLSVK
jgi:alcohol dehydrogenase YqhD (iron-dependent ADH family)